MTYQLLEESPALKRAIGEYVHAELEKDRKALEALAELFNPWRAKPDPLIHSWRWLQKDKVVYIKTTRWKSIAR